MKRLFSPWRSAYIQSFQGGRKSKGCLFCRIAKEDNDKENLIVWRGKKCFVVMNRYPYNNGHLMIVPMEHAASIEDLEPVVRQEMMEMLNQSLGLLRSVYHPTAFNFGANIGTAAGAGVADHVHLHVVPRWNGDTNFMSIVGETRVLPEEMTETYRQLRQAWEQFTSSSGAVL